MAKKKDDIAKPESAETLDVSSTEQKTPTDKSEKPVSRDVKKPDDEVREVWDDLSGKTQDRIVKLVRQNKALRESLERSQPAGNLMAATEKQVKADATSDTEVKEAIEKLREYGVATQDDLRALQDRNYLDSEHNRLETEFDGSGGLPKYIREEVEDYARTHGYGGNLKAAFKDMYQDEFIDAEVKKRRSAQKKTYTEKPSASVKIGEKPLTVESLRERLRKPDGVKWWAKNKEKIEPLLKKLSQT